jgi:maltose O-acetyltransferase
MKLWEIISFCQYGDLPTSYFKKRGMNIGKNFNRQSGTRMDPSHCWLISIGDDVTLSNKVQILAHDDTPRIYTGYGRIAPVKIGNRVFIGANTTVLMGSNIGDDVIIGAGSVVTGTIPSGSVAVGVPAKVIGKTEDYINREKERIENGLVFDKSYTYQQKVTAEKKAEMLRELEENEGCGYLEIGYYNSEK